MSETSKPTAYYQLDAKLPAPGWHVQNREDIELTADRDIAVHEEHLYAVKDAK